MRSELLTGRAVWRAITALAKQRAGHAAVAYCGTGSLKLLPLKRGSVLVVDASDGVVKAGLTDPRELKKFVRAGVRVHSAGTLHAKVFVFGDTAIIGSTNASNASAQRLIEAAVRIEGRTVAAASRRFVEGLVGEELDLHALKSLSKIYRPPRGSTKGARSGRRKSLPTATRKLVPIGRPLWAVRTYLVDWDETDIANAREARPAARRKLDRRNEELDEFCWESRGLEKLRDRDQVVEVVGGDGTGRVLPVGRVVKVKRYRRPGRKTRAMIVFLARPKGLRAIAEPRARKLLGRGSWLRDLQHVRQIRHPDAAHATRRLWRMA